jgi:thiamine monophosphate kinase
MVERSEGRAVARGHSHRRCRRLFTAYDAGTLARLAGVAHAMCDVSDELVAYLGPSCDASGVGVVIDVTALPITAAGWRHFRC